MKDNGPDQRLAALHKDWQHLVDEKCLQRKFSFKSYSKAIQLVNLCAWLAEQQNHHPDIMFGWGYVHVSLTTHDKSAVTDHDFKWAETLDRLLEKASERP